MLLRKNTRHALSQRRLGICGAIANVALAVSAPALLTGCDSHDGSSQESSLAQARALADAGDVEGARFALRRALADIGKDPAILLALAETELQLSRPDLAITTLEQASEAGAAPDITAELRARAYYDDNDVRSLHALANDASLTPRASFLANYFAARASAENPAASPEDVFDRFFSLFRARTSLSDTHEAFLGDMGVDSALSSLEIERDEVAQARAHTDCIGVRSQVTRWAPTPLDANRRVHRVGPGEAYATVAEAAAAANDGDAVEILAGDYPGDVAIWPQSNLLIRGVGGRPHIMANGRNVAQRDAWQFRGNDVIVENVEISGAQSPYHNGAAIRHVGSNLTLRHVYLHHNENGVLASRAPTSHVRIEYSEFAFNGYEDGKAHNLYIAAVASLDFRYNYSHDSNTGHLLKSRASKATIAYNRFTDETGTGSYLFDAANGGIVLLIGNVFEQAANTPNRHAISYGAEGLRYEDNDLIVLHNTLYNRAFRGVFLKLGTRTRTYFANNIAIGAPTGLVSTDYIHSVKREANITAVEHGVSDPANFDFSLTFASPAVDGGEVVSPRAQREYVHPVGWRDRAQVHRPDIGAYETCRGALVATAAR
ncbi:MAG: right-handed parallel beta-helix repeat-containing protein [Pseudomonadota bacterium]